MPSPFRKSGAKRNAMRPNNGKPPWVTSAMLTFMNGLKEENVNDDEQLALHLLVEFNLTPTQSTKAVAFWRIPFVDSHREYKYVD